MKMSRTLSIWRPAIGKRRLAVQWRTSTPSLWRGSGPWWEHEAPALSQSMPHEVLTLLVRWTHVIAMAGMLGGAVLVWAMSVRAGGPDLAEHGGLLLALAEKYERLFWLAMGVQVMTGAGNLGAFGMALPAPGTVWGGRFALKLLAVLIFLAFSLLRTLVLARLTQAGGFRPARMIQVFQSFYGGTALALAAIALLAVALAHG